ncbi:hypothetical protein C1645_819442 [Glomus cerebriforme]|uniref:C3H1-type domain-containing protein n=1 Tax=Glomus cerebriforme TaxID=658196 RepID=A0A397T8Y9_9GLOM|nr:hypothetical protein C1645_819442 [Glomus cerebriforme]
MTVCKFFLEGRCNFGATCRNEHPGDAQQRNNHRFGATDSNNPLRGRIGFPGSSTDYPPGKIYDERSVKTDLTKDRPEYKYSCYGPSKEEPNLLEGTDFSAEELRVQYYSIMSTNGVDTAYRAGVKDLEDRMQGQIDAILGDVRSALTRFDAKRQQLAQQQASSGFGFGQQPQSQHQPAPQRQGAYGTPSALGAPAPSATPLPFGSSINQPNTPSLLGSTYNQPTAPSLFGSNPSGFGTSNFSASSSLNYPGAQPQPNPGSIFGGGLGNFQPPQQPQQQPQQPQQPDPQQQYLLQMQQQRELLAQQQQQQQQQMLQQQMLQQQQMQQQPPQPGNTQGTINNPQMQAFASSEFELYKIPEIPPPSDYRR